MLHNQVRPAVVSGQAPLVSAMPLSQRISFSIVLPPRNPADLDSLLDRLYDPSSPDFHHFLTADQFTAQFGPIAQDYQAVVAFAQTHGFTVTGSPANRLVVPLSGTVEQIESAFSVRMNVYQHPTENRTFFSPDRNPSLNISVPVAGISGLDNFSLPHPMVIPPWPDQPQTGAVTGSGPGGSYLGSDMRAAYYGGTTLDGNGQTVGLLEFDGYNISDVNSSFSNAGQTYNVPIQNVLLDGATGAPVTSNGEGEVVLDIVQAIGMAPGLSQVRVYIGTGNDDANLLNSMAAENVARQISCSWSWFPADPAKDDVFFKEMAAQGQSFFTASGDAGAFDLSISPYFYPQEDAWVTAVGGTHLTTTAAAGAWSAETAWNASPDGSGGGISPDNIAIPSWQSGTANTSNGGSTTLRNVPDVAMEGDFDNYNCRLGLCSGGWAGTSFAAPRWAGFMALVNEQAVEAGNAPLGGIGFVNPSLYLLGQGASYADQFHDIVSGNNDTDNQPVSWSAVAGYDLVTGWGSPTGQKLIDALAGPQVPGFWILGSPATIDVSQGKSNSATISVSDAGGFGGNVTLAVASSLPTGVTASWGTNPTSSSSVLTLTADSSAPVSTTPLRITATSGNLSAATTVTVAVHAPTFALSAAPNIVGISQGANATSTVTVTPEYGFTGSVNLSISGLPTGVTASFSPTSTTGTSTLTLTAGSSAPGGTSTLTITGISGNITQTTTLSLTIHAPSFQLLVPPTFDMGKGTTSAAFIDITPLYGFTGNVNLSVSGLPSGVTGSFNPNPATGSSTLTLTASPSAAPGTSSVTITGTSGDITSTATIALTIHQPTFALSTPPSLDMGQGTSANSYVYITPQYGFTGNVTFSVSGLPAGVTALWNPNPSASSSSLTLTAGNSVSPGTSTVTVTGTSGSITVSTTFTLTIHSPSFTLSGGGTVNIGQGTSASTYIDVYPQYGFTGNVNLSVSGLPSGVTASFSQNPTTGFSTLTFTASSSAALGTKTVTVTGTSGSLTASTTVTLAVYVPTFTISAYSPVNLGQGTSSTAYVSVTQQYGFTGNVTFSVSGLPSGVTASFSPNPNTYSTTLTLTASSTAPTGQHTLTITGTSGSQTATTTLTVGIYVPTFTISSFGSVSVGEGNSTTASVWVNPQYGFTGTVNFTISGLPAGVTASFAPDATAVSSTLTLTAGSTVAAGQYNLTIKGTSGTQTATTTLVLGVYTPTFTLTAGAVNMGQGSSGTGYVWFYSHYGFSGSVNLSVSGLPSGVTASLSPNPITAANNSSTLTLTATNAAAPGNYTLTVTGNSGSQTATTTVPLTINPQSFTLYADSYSLTLNQGTSGSTTVTVSPQYGFTGSVTFSASGLPTGVTASFAPSFSTSSSTLTLNVSSSAAPVRSVPLTITGTSGRLTASTNLILTVNAQGFALNNAPGEIELPPAGSGESTLVAVPQNGFDGSVTLSASGLPTGVTASFSPNPTTNSSVLTLTAAASAAAGSTTIGITGTSGLLTATSSVVVKVSAAAPASTTTTLQVTAAGKPAGSIAAGTLITLTADVTSGSGPLKTGQVNFCEAVAKTCDASHLIGNAQLTDAGTATLKFFPGMGVHSYKAVFAGTNTEAVSSSSAADLTVTAAQATTTTLTPSGSAGNYTLTATVTGQGAAAPTGTVSFLDTTSSNAVLGTGTLGKDNPTISWGNPQSPAVGQDPDAIAVGDLNGDGIPDLAVVNYYAGTVTILLGKGDGTFAATASSPATGSYPQAIVVGDFNRDGKLDLAVANSNSNNLTVLLGNGDGTFTATPDNPATGSEPVAIGVGDFNGDGNLDLAVVNGGSSTITVELGNGDGTFTPSPLSAQTGTQPRSLVIGDFNGDGILDLAMLTNYSGSIGLLIGNGDGSFAPANPISLSSTNYSNILVGGDFNQDGRFDLALIEGSADSSQTFLGNGDGTFTAAPATSTSLMNAANAAVADLNGDGIPDLVETNSYQGGVLFGNGDGTFAAPVTLSAGSGPSIIAVSDFDGNGTEDLAITSSYNNNVTILVSQLSHTVTAVATSIAPVGTGAHSVQATYPGNTSYKASVSPAVSLQAQPPAPKVTVSPSSSAITTAQSLTVSITVAGLGGQPGPTGTITLSSGTYTSAVTPLVSGAATITVPAGSLAIGTDTLTVAYTPDASSASNYGSATGSASVAVSQPIGTSAATITATPSASTITNLQSVTVNVTVSGAAGQPTGTVTLSGGSYTAWQALTSGAASFTIAAGALGSGSDTLTAAYSGDAAYATGSATTVVAVAPVSIAAPTLAAANPGSSATGNLTFSAGSSYSGTLSLSCTLTSSPSGAQSLPACSLNPASIVLTSGGTGTAALTITTTAASTASLVVPAQFQLWKFGGAGSLLAFVLMFGIPARRRRWTLMLTLFLVMAIAGAIGCGGGGSGQGSQPPPKTPATTAGSYTFTVKATDSAANVTATTNVTLTVE